ncbi:DNA polymerase I [Marinilabiliaceae bacterium ANBcel2]|nr:DNA polymerase I [Marinilabiliaceae bacterium ANBcel2]
MSKKSLYLLDAYALIFRAYYAFIRAPRVNSKGLNTSAIYGFTNTLLDILQKQNPQYLAVVIDYSGPTFRNEIYPEYKANREETPEDIKKAVPYIKTILQAMNIPLLEIEGYEADDVIGTVALQASNDGYDTYMVTPDKDFAQLVNENIKVLKPRSRGNDVEVWDPETVKERFNVPDPANVVDVLALWGDASDNVPGCPGIGEKRSKEIIKEYHSIENVYKNIEKFKGKQKENLINYKDQVELSKKLITICTNVPFKYSVDSFKREDFDNVKLKELLTELEFKNIFDRLFGTSYETKSNPQQRSLFGEEDNSLTDNGNGFDTIENIEHNYHLIDNELALSSLLVELSVQKTFCFDTETSGLGLTSSLVGIAFSWKPHEAWYLPLPAQLDAAKDILERVKAVFEDPTIEKIGQNLKYDILMLKKYGLDIKGPFFDTMVAHHLIEPGLRHNMNFLAETYLNYSPLSIESLIGAKGKNQGSIKDVDVKKVTEYAGEDADITFQLRDILLQELKKENLQNYFFDVEMSLLRVLTIMEFNGIKIDIKALNDSSETLHNRLIKLEKQIHSIAGIEFNVNSPRQVGEILFEKLKIDAKASKTKTGQYTTNEEVLQRLKDKHTIVPLILEQRGLKKLLSTYISALPDLVNSSTGRLHTSFNQAVVVTGRLSSSNPNLQNIPIRDEEGKEIRKAFVASDENHILFSADYSQVELRLMAHFSGDKDLIEAFKRGDDIHSITASKIFNVDSENVTSEMRRKAKTANFGIIYGISAFGLAERLSISRTEAKNIIDGYFKSFPGVKVYMEKSIRDAREKGYVTTLFGRKRYLPDINSRNSVVRGVAERNAINAPIQGTAADIIKKAMVDIYRIMEEKEFNSKMILQVHDELIFDTVKEELDELKSVVINSMESVCDLSIPLLVESGEGYNWLEAH